MQKIINAIAILSGVVSLTVVGGGTYLYMNKDTLVEDARGKITKAVTEAVAGSLPGLVSGSMPELPSQTGGAIPGIGGSALPF